MADHRRRKRPATAANRGSARGRSGRSVAVGVAAAGVTLVVGAAGALHVTSASAGGDGSSSSSVSGAGTPDAGTPAAGAGPSAAPGSPATAAPSPVRPNRVAGSAGGLEEDGAIPGIGSVMMARVPREALQAIVVTGGDRDTNTNTVTLWRRATPDAPWAAFGAPMTGRNGANGWTTSHHEGDLRSPIGVFSLTAAGGRLPDPGTGMPYEYRPSFYQTAAPQGEPLADAFNYVVAIDYNRLAGRPPSDPARPLGAGVGGDIWLHVDHQSPTRGCVALLQDQLVSVMRWLDPAAHPMIIMGGAADLGADV
ncbi:conserved exported hypothetical protein [Frankia canadensis]|uniref:YkuD domain-containing protein n=1 Tax=Frankia canadensis TaxID=1836972 RepID=A0A2I2KW55_9ACTN|nr:hypothetical protein [Frankia canadensis]SNQ49876.1 conserved exported hypothetical protein [Frankia canadensis]SOU57166.1 conserved exported hypothetical protein [Frankia canadensis]